MTVFPTIMRHNHVKSKAAEHEIQPSREGL